MADRKPFDLDAYVRRIWNPPCFICEMVAGRLNDNHVIYQDNPVIDFLNKYPIEALRVEGGILDLSETDMQDLARRIRENLDDPGR